MTEFHGWLETLAPKVLPQSKLGKAVHYALGQWRKLAVFLTHGEVPMTNNLCENAIRPFVVGRKGWLFSDTVKGAVASCKPVLTGGDSKGQRHRTACLSDPAVHAVARRRIGRGLRGTAALEPRRRVTSAADGQGDRRNLSKAAWAIPGSSTCAIISPPQVPSPRCPGARGSSQSISPASWSMPPAISMRETHRSLSAAPQP